MSEGLFLTSCILQLCAIIPVLGYLALLGNLVISIIMIVQIGTCLNALVAVKNNGWVFVPESSGRDFLSLLMNERTISGETSFFCLTI
jgi:hypothetical protein